VATGAEEGRKLIIMDNPLQEKKRERGMGNKMKKKATWPKS
jgi:hypothetical protein